jgi:WD40 repeat protein
MYKRGRTLSICDTDSGDVVHAWNTPYSVEQMALSPDGAVVVTSGSSILGRYVVFVSLWETRTGRLIAEEEWHKPPAGELAVAWSPDSTYIAVGGLDKCVRVWKRPGNIIASQ